MRRQVKSQIPYPLQIIGIIIITFKCGNIIGEKRKGIKKIVSINMIRLGEKRCDQTYEQVRTNGKTKPMEKMILYKNCNSKSYKVYI